MGSAWVGELEAVLAGLQVHICAGLEHHVAHVATSQHRSSFSATYICMPALPPAADHTHTRSTAFLFGVGMVSRCWRRVWQRQRSAWSSSCCHCSDLHVHWPSLTAPL